MNTNNDIAAVSAASALPSPGQSLSLKLPSLEHLQSRAAYLAFRAEWRQAYRWLSRAIRARNRLRSLSDSVAGSKRAGVAASAVAEREAALARAAALPEDPPPAWWRLVSPHRTLPNALYFSEAKGNRSWGEKAWANWLLDLRALSKRHAQIGWQKSKAQAQTPAG